MNELDDYVAPEDRARVRIDAMLVRAGWAVQDYRSVNLYAGRGVAVRELVTAAGPADYVLFVDRHAVGVIEAKKRGTTLAGVEWQTVKYQSSIPDELRVRLTDDGRLPFGYETTGDETWFTCRLDPESDSPIHLDDALRDDPGERFDLVLANPPFGKKSSVTIVNAEGKADRQNQTVVRDDFWASTSNKQLNFVQHIRTLLKVGGQAAVVVPDNVLFEGGAGETVRRKLLHECNVHTLLRLPTGIFYAQGVKANVLFFERKPGSEDPWTKELWIYDLRTNQHFTLKQNPLTRKDLDDFVACYRPGDIGKRKETERFKRFAYDDLVARDKASLDIFWLRDESLEDTDNLPAPGVIAAEIVEELEAALEEFRALAESLEAIGVDVEDPAEAD